MDYGYQSAKGLRASDAKKGINMNKRPDGPVKTMGHPCDLKSATPANKLGYSKSIPTDLDPRYDTIFGFPKTRIY